MKLVTLLLAASLLVAGPAQAVKVEPEGYGQALIFPYVGVKGGNTSLISISTPRAAALKVNFRDLSGALQRSLNVYTNNDATWVAALSQQNDGTQLTFPDAGCVLSGDEVLTSTPVDFESGFVEVVHMGEIDDPGVRDLIRDDRCERLLIRWDNSPWSSNPSADLTYTGNGVPPTMFGKLTIINVAKGLMFSVPVTGLSDFSNIVQHTRPGNPLPNLGSAHDEGTPDGATSSTNCSVQGCQTDSWGRPVDAVAAALMSHELKGTFSIEASVAAKTEVVVTQPLAHVYQESQEPEPFTFTCFEMYVFDRSGDGYRPSRPCLTGIRCFFAPYRLESPFSVVPFAFSANLPSGGEGLVSEILGEPLQSFVPNADYPLVPESGSFSIEFEELAFFEYRSESIRSLEGSAYWGLPAIAVSFTEVSNNTLTGEEVDQLVKANYGDAAALMRVYQGQ